MADDPENIVLILHGIRDMAGWQGAVRKTIESMCPGFKCLPVRYGWFGPVSFISPLSPGGKAYSKLHKQYQSINYDYPNAKISIIAHSFGTHLVGRLLRDNPNAKFHRIILCGGVLSREFDWRACRDQLGAHVPRQESVILNECGNSDPWPIIAESINSRYGASGAYGFEAEHRITERHYEGGHDLFFDRDHVENYWVPFLSHGEQGLGENTARIRNPRLIERVLLSVPGTKPLLQLFVVIAWAILALWWLWMTIAVLGAIACAAGVWPCTDPSALCLQRFDPIDYNTPADFNFINPSNDPRFPDQLEVANATPAIPDGPVAFEFSNDSDFDLWLLFFDCSHFYSQGGTPWLAIPAPANSSSEQLTALQSKSGLYIVYAYRPELGDPIWLRRVNLRNSKLTTLAIRCEDSGLTIDVRP